MARHFKESAAHAGKKSPHKKSLSQTVYTLLMVLFLGVFLFSGGMLVWNLWLQPAQNEAVNDDIRDLFSQAMTETGGSHDKLVSDTEEENASGEEDVSGGEEAESSPEEQEDPDIRGELRRCDAVRYLAENVNSDIVGWITVDGTVIDYPVLQSSTENDEYYLKRNYREQYSDYGSIFLDSYCSTGGDIQVLYGHSMNDGSMFRSLVGFGDPGTVSVSPIIQYDTADEASQWLIVSVFKTNTLPSQGKVFGYIRTGFSSAEDKQEYIYQVMQRSIVNTHVGVNENDDLLVLSTCSYEFDDFRTVVVARRLRPGETVPAANVSWAANTLYPDCWYEKYGGEAYPWPATFAEAREQGLIDWYR